MTKEKTKIEKNSNSKKKYKFQMVNEKKKEDKF